MKINKIEIDGFKGIKELVIEPQKFNVIIGKNNTSKSSLLEATFFAILFNEKVSFDSLIHRGEIHLEGVRPLVLSHIINVKKKESNVTINLENDTKKIRFYRPEEVEVIKKSKKQIIEDFEWLLTKAPEFKRNTIAFWNNAQKKNSKQIKDELDELGKIIDKIFSDDKQFLNIAKGCVSLEKQDGTKFLNNIYLHRDLPKPLNEWLIKKGYDPLDFYFLRRRRMPRNPDRSIDKIPVRFINASNTFSFNNVKIVDEIQTYLTNNGVLDDVGELKRFDRSLLFQDKNGETFDIPYLQMGDGFKFLIKIIGSIKNSEIILLEEPENYMHPEYVKILLRTLIDFSKTKSVQFFITTHNFDILDFLVSDVMEPDHQEYLDKELKIIRMENIGNEITFSHFDRENAKSIINDINDDLRGI